MSESYKAVLKVWRTAPGERVDATGSSHYRTNPNKPEVNETVTTQPLGVEFTAGSLPELLHKIQGHANLLQPFGADGAAKEAPKKEKS